MLRLAYLNNVTLTTSIKMWATSAQQRYPLSIRSVGMTVCPGYRYWICMPRSDAEAGSTVPHLIGPSKLRGKWKNAEFKLCQRRLNQTPKAVNIKYVCTWNISTWPTVWYNFSLRQVVESILSSVYTLKRCFCILVNYTHWRRLMKSVEL